MGKKSPKPLYRTREPFFATYNDRDTFVTNMKWLFGCGAGVLGFALGVTIAANTSDDISGYDRVLVTNAVVDGRRMNIYGGIDLSCNVGAGNIARLAARADVAYIPIEAPEVIYGKRLPTDYTVYPGKTCSQAIEAYVGTMNSGTTSLGNYVVGAVQQDELGTQDTGEGLYDDIARALQEGVTPVPFQEV